MLDFVREEVHRVGEKPNHRVLGEVDGIVMLTDDEGEDILLEVSHGLGGRDGYIDGDVVTELKDGSVSGNLKYIHNVGLSMGYEDSPIITHQQLKKKLEDYSGIEDGAEEVVVPIVYIEYWMGECRTPNKII